MFTALSSFAESFSSSIKYWYLPSLNPVRDAVDTRNRLSSVVSPIWFLKQVFISFMLQNKCSTQATLRGNINDYQMHTARVGITASFIMADVFSFTSFSIFCLSFSFVNLRSIEHWLNLWYWNIILMRLFHSAWTTTGFKSALWHDSSPL